MNCPYGQGFSHRGDDNLFRLAILDTIVILNRAKRHEGSLIIWREHSQILGLLRMTIKHQNSSYIQNT